MRRRTFMTLIGSAAAAWPLAVRAQQRGQMRRIGLLSLLSSGDPEGRSYVAALVEGLNGLGWLEGRDIHIERRFASGRLDLVPNYCARTGRL